jgi:predicted Zn-dependent protease
MLLAPSARAAADRPTPGFNLFSIEQDIEIGRQSAVEAEQQLLMLGDRNVDGYLGRIIARLAAQAVRPRGQHGQWEPVPPGQEPEAQ